MDVSTVADAHQSRVIRVSDIASARALNLWRRMDFQNLDASWAGFEPSMVAQATLAQVAVTNASNSYVSQVSKASDFSQEPNVAIPDALVGVDGSGRPLSGMLFGAVTTTKEAIKTGLGQARSMEAGAAFLSAMMKTVVHDIGRSSDMVSATGRGYTHYVRVVNPGACSRCAILAGISSYKVAFRRHPACKCTSCAVASDDPTDIPEGLHGDPDSYFDSLSKDEQDRVFTKSGAEAIRSGAGVQEVVSARRGATGITTSRGVGRGTVANSGRRLQKTRIGTAADGSPIEVYTTSEGTTRRGQFGQQQRTLGTSGRVRLMPETLMTIARNPEEAKALLRDGGYMGIPNLSFEARQSQAFADRVIAEKAYARAGFTL